MAEGFARKLLKSGVNAESAGTHAMSHGAAALEAIEVMRSSFEIDISSHRSRNVKDVPIHDFDHIIAMDSTVAGDLKETYPKISAKLISWNIDDPIGKGIETYEKCAKEIQKQVEELSACLKQK